MGAISEAGSPKREFCLLPCGISSIKMKIDLFVTVALVLFYPYPSDDYQTDNTSP